MLIAGEANEGRGEAPPRGRIRVAPRADESFRTRVPLVARGAGGARPRRCDEGRAVDAAETRLARARPGGTRRATRASAGGVRVFVAPSGEVRGRKWHSSSSLSTALNTHMEKSFPGPIASLARGHSRSRACVIDARPATALARVPRPFRPSSPSVIRPRALHVLRVLPRRRREKTYHHATMGTATRADAHFPVKQRVRGEDDQTAGEDYRPRLAPGGLGLPRPPRPRPPRAAAR